MNKADYQNIIDGVSMMAEEYFNKYTDSSGLFLDEEEKSDRNSAKSFQYLGEMNKHIGAWEALNQVVRVLKSKDMGDRK